MSLDNGSTDFVLGLGVLVQVGDLGLESLVLLCLYLVLDIDLSCLRWSLLARSSDLCLRLDLDLPIVVMYLRGVRGWLGA